MTMIKKIVLGVAFLLSFQLEANSKKIEIYQETLSNGLKVIIISKKSNGAARFGVFYNVGCADDHNCKVGLSHFLEHMMFKGTKNVSGAKLKKLLDKYNDYTNACTDDDYTLYYHSLNKNFLIVDMKLEADRMENLSLNAKDVKMERDVVMEERHLRCDANPEVRHVFDAVPRLLYLHSSYAYNGIGYPHHIKAYTKQALQRHYDKYYVPNNATVIVVGDVDKEEVMNLVKSTFGKIKKTHEVKKERVIDPEDLTIKYTMDRSSDKITKKEVSIAYKIQRKNIDTLKKRYIAKIAIECLCGSARSLMYKKFVEEENSLHSIDGNIDIKQFDKAFFVVDAVVPNEKTVKESEQQVVDYIGNVSNKEKISKVLTKEIFEATKKRILNQILIMNDNPGDMFSYVVENLVVISDMKDVSNVFDIVSKINWEDVKNWILENLKEENRTLTFYSYPKASNNKDS